MRQAEPQDALELHDAYRLAAVAKRAEVEAAVKAADGPAKALLQAVVAQYSGDVDRAISLLQRQLLRLPIEMKAFVADILAPIFVMRNDGERVRELSQTLSAAGWHSCAHAFLALVEAEKGGRSIASDHMTLAKRLLAFENDEVIRFRVLQRLAFSAFYMKQFDEALDLAFASAAISSSHGAWRAASSAYSIAYNIHHTITGNLAEADRLARLCSESARRSDDISFIHTYTVAEYEIAVQVADDLRIRTLEEEMQRRPLPQQYTERFPLRYSQAIVMGMTDLLAMRSVLEVLIATPNLSRGQLALALAVTAISYAAENEDDKARDSVRHSLTALGRMRVNDPAYERGYRRMARAFASVACHMVGDHVRGGRIVHSAESLTGHGEHRLLEHVRNEQWYPSETLLRGAMLVCKLAIERRSNMAPPAGLTSAELEVLKLLASGYNAVKIAKETQRSVNTIYNHSRAILEKLDASRVGEAIAIARRRGIAL